MAAGLDPNDPDSDGDGVDDLTELLAGTDPLVYNADDTGGADTAGDTAEGDTSDTGMSETDPDTDGDGLTDRAEIRVGTDVNDSDSDNDGLSDGDEVIGGTDALSSDSDLDGVRDGDEVDNGTDPLDPDTDADGYTDLEEIGNGTDPLTPDEPITDTGDTEGDTGEGGTDTGDTGEEPEPEPVTGTVMLTALDCETAFVTPTPDCTDVWADYDPLVAAPVFDSSTGVLEDAFQATDGTTYALAACTEDLFSAAGYDTTTDQNGTALETRSTVLTTDGYYNTQLGVWDGTQITCWMIEDASSTGAGKLTQVSGGVATRL